MLRWNRYDQPADRLARHPRLVYPERQRHAIEVLSNQPQMRPAPVRLAVEADAPSLLQPAGERPRLRTLPASLLQVVVVGVEFLPYCNRTARDFLPSNSAAVDSIPVRSTITESIPCAASRQYVVDE